MPEGVMPYPRLAKGLPAAAAWRTLAAHEVRLALRGRWTILPIALAAAWGLVSIIEVVQLRETADATFVRDAYVSMLEQIRWGVVAIAVVIGAPLVLADVRAGAMEAYYSRGLTRGTYFGGKATALFSMATLSMAVPAVLYYIVSLAVSKETPSWWHGDAALGLVYAIGWGAMVSGVALGISSLLRSSTGAMLTVLAVFVGLDLVVRRFGSYITEKGAVAVASPFACYDQVASWLWRRDAPHDFPVWWGFMVVLALTVAGWAIAYARTPRARGEA